MKWRTRGALLGLVMGLCASSSLAISAPVSPATKVQAPNWTVGSEWYYSDGYALKVTSVSSQVTVFDRLDAPGQWFSRQGFIRKDAASSTATRNSIYRTIPDTAGFTLSAASPLTFQREYLSNGKLLVHASSWTVEGRETITVPAGTFDCWLIVWRTRSLRSDWTGFERWWYSPQIQNYVRMEFKYGSEPDASRVLMRYHLGSEPAAAPASNPVAPIAPLAPTSSTTVAPTSPSVLLAKGPVLTAREPQNEVRALPVIPEISVAAERTAVESQTKAARPAAAPRRPGPEMKSMAAVVHKPDLRVARGNSAHAVSAPKTEAQAVGAWHAQVGSSKDAAAMRASLQKTLQAHPQAGSLPSGLAAHNVANRGTFYRAWLGSYDNASGALGLCHSLEIHGTSCTVFKGANIEARAD